jgi:hypothetical protein
MPTYGTYALSLLRPTKNVRRKATWHRHRKNNNRLSLDVCYTLHGTGSYVSFCMKTTSYLAYYHIHNCNYDYQDCSIHFNVSDDMYLNVEVSLNLS